MNDSLDCLQAYKEYLIEREMSENTIEKYLRDVRAFVRYMGGRELERAEVLRYKKELLAQYKITSANSMLTALNHFFKWLGRNELCMKTCRQQRQIFRDAEKDLTNGPKGPGCAVPVLFCRTQEKRLAFYGKLR